MGNEINNNNHLNEIDVINFGHFQINSEEIKNNLLEPLNKLEDKISNDLNEIDNFINENNFNVEEEEKIIEEEDEENINTNVKYAESKKKFENLLIKLILIVMIMKNSLMIFQKKLFMQTIQEKFYLKY